MEGGELEEELIAVSTSVDNLMAHARADAIGKGANDLTVFERVGNGHIAYVTFKADPDDINTVERAKYFIHTVLVV